MAGFGGTGGAANCSAAALTFLGRPLVRTGLAVAIGPEADRDGVGSVGVETDTGRIWVYLRDDKPFGGPAPPGAVFYFSRDRAGSGIFQADAYDGYGKLYEAGRTSGSTPDGLSS
jgi:hypothetical protein